MLADGLNLASINGDATWRLPISACYIITKSSMIADSDLDPDYSQCAEPSDLLAALRGLGKNPGE
jgi:hypothetical protein